jgi:hypothetical protein
MLAPLPNLGHERLATHRLAGELVVAVELLFHDGLRGNARVVGAGQPERLESRHAAVPDHDVLQRVVQRVAHVQDARHVRRRDHDQRGAFDDLASARKWLPASQKP